MTLVDKTTQPTLAVPHGDELFVGSQWVSPARPETVDIVSPTTGETIATVPDVSIADADRAVASARRAFDDRAWSTMSVEERAVFVERYRAAFDERVAAYNQAWAAETGIPFATAEAFGQAASALAADSLETARSLTLSERRDTPLGSVEVRREPIGPTLSILTYNGAATEVAFGVLPALLMGNTVIVKLPPENRMLGHFLADALDAAGFPDGVVTVLTADTEVSKYLVAHDDIDLVHFTGGTEIGSEVASVCAKRVARVTLELGGKAAAIVADDVDFDDVIPTLMGGMVTFQGQLCIALTRVLVSRHRHDEFVAKLVEAIEQVRIGDPADPATDFGPLPSERIRARAEGYIERAVAEGATIATGGKRPEGFDGGFFLEPTLLVNVDNSMEVAQNEIFGPVYTVIPYDDVDDAVRIANDTKYGLLSAVFSNDHELAMNVAGRFRTGVAAINANFPCLAAPYGGVKQSGYGRVSGPEGMLELTNIKQVVLPAQS